MIQYNYKNKTNKNKNHKMGVYIIKSKHANWFKVGHHKISASRPNVYYRYINRGFYSVICPEELQNRVGFWDVELLYFFKNLTTRDERQIHRDLRSIYRNCGEWYYSLNIAETANLITTKYQGVNEMPTRADLDNAFQWRNEIRQRRTYN
jgi:hypothetical protein